MVGNAQECHANARQCTDLAADVEHPALKETFFVLANKWTSLAIKLEKTRQRRRPSAKRTTKLVV
jgi:hypothetical protein